jgi:hypothetical protein
MEVKKSTKRWRAENKWGYWFIDFYGDVIDSLELYEHIDNGRYNLGNYYQTKEQAEFARDKQLAIVKINDRIAELNGTKKSISWHINYIAGLFHADWSYDDFIPQEVLSVINSEEVADQIIEEFRDELMKYIFN